MTPSIQRVLVVGDLHFRKDIVYKYPSTGQAYWEVFLQELLQHAYSCDVSAITFLGDIFDRVNPVHPSVLQAVNTFFERLIEQVPTVQLVTGNHDMYTTTSGVFDYLKWLGIRIDTLLTLPLEQGRKLNLIPVPYYLKDTITAVTDLPYYTSLDPNDYNVYVAHLPLKEYESIGNLSIDDLRSDVVIDYYITGHYHFGVQQGHFISIGVPYGSSFADANRRDYKMTLVEASSQSLLLKHISTMTPFEYRYIQAGEQVTPQLYVRYKIKKVDTAVTSQVNRILASIQQTAITLDFDQLLQTYVQEVELLEYLKRLLNR